MSSGRIVRDPAWWAAFACYLALSLVWAFGNPILSNPDEPAQAVRAASLVRGQIVPPKEDLPDYGPTSILRGGFTNSVTVPRAYARQTAKSQECYIGDPTIDAGCAPEWVDDPEPTTWTTLNGRYPPPYYALIGWPTLFDTSVWSFYSLRVLSGVLCAALLATAFALARQAPRFRLLALAVPLAATPQLVQLAGSVNPNALEAAAGVATWAAASVALTWEGPSVPNRVLVALGASASLLAFSRPLATLWLLVVAVGCLAAFGRRDLLLQRLGLQPVRRLVVVVGVVAVGAAVWTVATDNLGNNRGYNPWGLGLVEAVQHSLALSWSYLQQMVAVFGWDRTTSPAPLTWAWGAALTALVAAAVRVASRRERWALLGVTLVVFLMPTLLQARTARSIGFVWSGRYGLAIAAGIPVIAAVLLGRTAGRAEGPGLRRTAAAVLVLTSGGQVVAHLSAMRRYMVGTDGPLVYVRDAGWHPPVPAAVLLAVAVVASSGLGLLAWRVAFGAGAPTPSAPPA